MTSSAIASGVFIAAVPIVQIGVLYRLFWVPDHPEVNRKSCECSCFDAIFKGSYEMNAIKHGYKHVYFNATWQTMCVWAITVAYMLLGYEAVKTFTSLLISRSLRPVMAAVFCIGIYPHIFGWWAMFNYYNDDFYPMLNHQIYFVITEMVSTYAILKLCDRHVEREQWLYSLVIGTATVHILVAGPEEFFINLFQGRAHQFWRDLGLATADLVNIVLPLVDYFKHKDVRTLDAVCQKRCVCLPRKSDILKLSNRMMLVFIYCILILILGYVI